MSDAASPAAKKGVSVVIPSLNSAATIGMQLAALAEQDWDGPWEVIVADNGSTDATTEVARSWSERLPALRVVDAGDRRGASHARNVGASHARYPAIIWVDADDRVAAGWLRLMGEAAQGSHFFCSWYTGGGTGQEPQILAATSAPSRGVPDLFADRAFLASVGGCEGIGVSREVFDLVGGFEESMVWGSEDAAFCWSVQLAGYPLERVDGAEVHVLPRSSARDFFAQQKNWGVGAVDLHRRYADRGAPRSNTVGAITKWAALLATSPVALVLPSYRWRWMGTFARRWGRLVGSIRFRYLYL